MKKRTRITAGLLIASTFISSISAQAAGLSVSADRTANLLTSGDTVTVTLTNVPADQGLYVRLCQGTLAEASTARPTNCYGQGNWVSNSATSQGQGAGDATKPVQLAVKAQFVSGATLIDCTIQACGIHIRRDHIGGSTDYSLDRFIPITFAAHVASQTSATLTHGKLSLEIIGQNGKSITIKFDGKTIVKKATSDNYKLNFAIKKSVKTLPVSIKSESKVLFAKNVKLTK